MGSVLAFQPREAATVKRPSAGVTASIVIFPGVRYERGEPDARQTDADPNGPRQDKPTQPRH
jgi:hypothetical protein